jgi:hypothetical protein
MAKPQPMLEHQQSLAAPLFDLKAEKERIRAGGPLLITERDEQLHSWLDEQRESGNPGFICSAQGSGVSDSCQFYRMQHVKRRGVMQELPVSVVYARVPALCSLTSFYTALLEALNHPLSTGKLKDLRPRARGRLKSFRTQLLIIDDAEFLTYEVFCELAQFYDMLKIPAVLSGTYYLENVLRQGPWTRVFNAFLDYYEYPPMTQDEMVAVIDYWEQEFLKWPEESDFLLEDVYSQVFEKTKGLRNALNEVLRKSAIRALDQGSNKISAEIILSVLGRRNAPRAKPRKEE